MAFNEARRSLKRVGVRPSKQFGQNFLQDESVLREIVEFGAANESNSLVEIGPGLGALTAKLAHFPNLTLIELERRFCDELSKRFPHAKIVQADAREFDYSSIGSGLLVFGNLPYSFSTEIIFQLVKHAKSIKRAILMLQREFAERLAAKPGGRDYGVLSVSAQLHADIELGSIVSGDSFYPTTQVDSRILRLTFLPALRYEIKNLDWFNKVVRASFVQRRRKLLNSLKASGMFEQEQILKALSESGIEAGRRAETLSIPEFMKLAESLQPPASRKSSL